MNEREPGTPDAERLNRTADRFGQWIFEGITAAYEGHREIDDMTARLIAHVLGRSLGRESALAGFGRTGEGNYETLRDEYLPLYTDPTTPEEIRSWIDWLGTYLVQREALGSGRQFMNEHLPPKLTQVLVRTEITVGDEQFTTHVPANYSGAEVTNLAETLTELSLNEDPALQAFLSLPDVNAMSGDIMESFHEAFAGTFHDAEAALRSLSPLEEWESDLAEWVIEHGIDPNAVQWNLDPLIMQLRDAYDLVEWKGTIHAFNK